MVAPGKVFAATSPTLGAVGSYSVLGNTTVTNTGATTMPGDLGISIGGAPVGFPPGTVGPPGTIRNAGDSLAAQNADTAGPPFFTRWDLPRDPRVFSRRCLRHIYTQPHEVVRENVYLSDADAR